MISGVLQQPKGFYRSVIALMIPMVLQNIISQSMTLADAFMVGVLGEQYLAAVTIATTPIFVFMLCLYGVQSGAGILVAQYWGKDDKNTINRVVGIGIYCAVIVSLTGAIILWLFPDTILGLVTKQQELVEISAPYAKIAGFAMVLNSITLTYIACQRSMENTRLGFIVLSVSSILSIALKWVFIFGNIGMPALGITGAALSTLIARVVEVSIIVIHAFRNSRLPIKIKLLLRPGITIFRDYIKYSLPVICSETLWGFGTTLIPVILGHMSGAEQILAAYNISGNLDRLVTIAVMACADATAIIIGREIGAGHQQRVGSVSKSLIVLGTGIGLCSGALLTLIRFTILEPFIYPLFNLSNEASINATIMLTLLVVIIPLRTVGWTMGIGVLRGGGDVKIYAYIDVGVLYLVVLPMAVITGSILKLGITIVYSSLLVESALKLPLIFLRFRSKKWIHNITRENLE